MVASRQSRVAFPKHSAFGFLLSLGCCGAAQRKICSGELPRRGGRSEEGTSKRPGSLRALHLPGSRRASGAAPHGGRLVAELKATRIIRARSNRYICRYRPLATITQDRRLMLNGVNGGPGDKGEDHFESMDSATLRRPCDAKNHHAIDGISSPTRSADTDTRQRISRGRGGPFVARGRRAARAAIRSATPWPAEKRGDESAREGPALSGPSLAWAAAF